MQCSRKYEKFGRNGTTTRSTFYDSEYDIVICDSFKRYALLRQSPYSTTVLSPDSRARGEGSQEKQGRLMTISHLGQCRKRREGRTECGIEKGKAEGGIRREGKPRRETHD